MRVVAEGIGKRYALPGGAGSLTALDGVDLVLESGACCFLHGASGSGKTTLLAIIADLARPTAGRVLRDGSVAPPSPGSIACSLQEPVFIPELTVQENLLLPASRCRQLLPPRREEELLERFGLDGLFDLFPAALSGGERRRLDLARALLLPAGLYLLDEPTASLDDGWSRRVMALVMEEVRRREATLLVATHECLPEAAGAQRLRLEKGRMVDHGDY